jgi:hypothetical protein
MKDFTQVYFSNSIKFFQEGFIKKWNLKDYTDPNKPSIFLGLYSPQDYQIVKDHKSYGIVSLTGGDMVPQNLNFAQHIIDNKRIFCYQAPGFPTDIVKKYSIPHKSLFIAMKDYSAYSSCPLGENIYVYKGVHGNRPDYFKFNSVISSLIEVFGEDRITYTEFKTPQELIENYYKDCFVYVKPNDLGGATSMFELAHMGRKTLGGGFPNLDYLVNYKDIYHLIDLIQEEAKYMGTIREEISTQAKNTFIGDEWLNLSYWL